MTKLSALEQLEIIKNLCEQIEEKHPARRASYDFSFTGYDKELRDGIVFWSNGWGWRLRRGWRETWQRKYSKIVDESDGPGEP